MKLLLVQRQAVFGITHGVFRKSVCFCPTNNSEHDKKYCKILQKILKEKHVKSKDLDLMIQFILPVPGKNFGSIRIYDAFFTLKTLRGILNDPDMKIVVSIFDPPLIGRGPVISTKEMSLDPKAFPIIPICNDDHVSLDKLRPVLDLLQDGSFSMLVSVSLEIEPRRRQEMMLKSPTVKDEKDELESEQPAAQSTNESVSSEKPAVQPNFSVEQSKKSVSHTEKVQFERNPAAKAKRRTAALTQTIPLEPNRDLPESIIRTIHQLNLADAKSEEQEEQLKPEKLIRKSESPVEKLEAANLTMIEPEVQIEPLKPLQVSAELSICRKILQDEIASDAIIMTKEGVLVNCHKSFLMAHSSIFTKMFQNGFLDGCPTNTIELADMTEKGVRALLAYLYCWDQSEAMECSLIAFELLSAGSNYDIPLLTMSLKKVFLAKQSAWFEPDVIVKLFLFARKLSTAEGGDLKEKAIKLMKELVAEC